MMPPDWAEEEEEEAAEWEENYDAGFEDDEYDEEEDFLDDEYGLEDEEADDDGESDDLDDMIEEGNTLVEEGEYEAALTIFREAAERFPESPEAVFRVGHAALLLFTDGVEETLNWRDDDDVSAAYEEALNAFENALSIDAEHTQALNSQGALYMVAENPKLAIECWERSIELDPEQDEIEAAIAQARLQVED